MNTTNSIAELIDNLRDHLRDYLIDHGHTPNEHGMFRCIHPAHNDKHPSCGIIPGSPQVFNCLAGSCGAKGNIFHAAEWFENLPRHGPEFITVTLPTLANRFGIDFDFSTVGDVSAILKMQKLWMITADAVNVLALKGFYDHAEARGWTKETCKDLGIGSIAYSDMVKELKALKWNEEDMYEAGMDADLFHKNGLTFTICDRWGRPMGFSTRNTKWERGGESPKYYNTPSRVSIYSKKNNLYNLHNVKNRFKEAVLVEGFGCVVTAFQEGIENLVAVCSGQISHEQVDLLVKTGITTVTIALDAEAKEHGTKSTSKALDNIFAGREDIRVKVLDLSEIAASDRQVSYGPPREEGHCDVDELIRIEKELYYKTKPVDPFEWRLHRFEREADPEEICSKMVPLIISEPNNIKRDKMARILADFTGIRKAAIDRDVDTVLKKDEFETRQELDKVRTNLTRQLSKASPLSLPDILDSAKLEVDKFTVVKEHDKVFNPHTTLTSISEMQEEFRANTTDLRGLRTGFRSFDMATKGLPPRARCIGFAALANVGKTALVKQILFQTALSNKNVMALEYSIDDSKEVALPRLVAMDARVPIDVVTHPVTAPNSEVLERINNSWYRVAWMIENNRYDIRDSSEGTDLSYLKEWLAYCHEREPDKHKIVVIDNFHKLSGPGTGAEKYANASDEIQKMKNNPKLGRPTFLLTLELNKVKGELSVEDISETRKIYYDCDMVCMLKSDFSASGENAEHYFLCDDVDTGEVDIKLPMVKMIVEKNKISGYKGVSWYKFFAMQSRFEEDNDYMAYGPRNHVNNDDVY